MRIENAWPAIIDKDMFQAVQNRMTSNAPVARHPRTVPSFYLLSSLLFCSCGQAMIGHSAKSHQYYYYVCSRSYKQGAEACSARSLPKDKLEHLVIEQIKERVLTQECLAELVRRVNEELDSANILFQDRLDAIDAELNDVKARLARLYDALETGKLGLDALSPRIKELRGRQDALNKVHVQVEADMVVGETGHVDVETVKSYANDLRSLLEDAGFTDSKTFLRSFVKRIVINGRTATVYYNLPLPPGGKNKSVLPIDTPGGAGVTIGRTFEMEFSLSI